MFEPYPFGLAGGRRSDRHGVIKRHPALAFSRSFFDPRDIPAHKSCLGTQSVDTCARTAKSRSSAYPRDRASSIRTQASFRICCGRRRGSRASRSGRSCNCTPIWGRWATTAPTIAWRLLPVSGRRLRQLEQRTTGRGVFVPLAFSTGEAFQFDWSEDWAIIAGERTKLQVAHFKLSYSRAFFPASLSAADTRDAVRRPQSRLPRAGRRS